MKVRLIKIYTETDSHGPDVKICRVYQDVDLLIEPIENQKIILKKGTFLVERIEQNLKESKIYLYEYNDISHYEFWSDKEKLRKKYLPPLLKEGWKESRRRSKK